MEGDRKGRLARDQNHRPTGRKAVNLKSGNARVGSGKTHQQEQRAGSEKIVQAGSGKSEERPSEN